MNEKRGTWPALCLQRAFVEGAAWWQYTKNGSTMFPSERGEAEAEAVRGYGKPGTDPIATAEERGRRSGVEERDELRDLVRSMHPTYCAATCPTGAPHEAICVDAKAALAARDSAPVCHCAAQLWHGGHLDTCALAAPRDSGKDNATAADPYDRFAKDDEP